MAYAFFAWKFLQVNVPLVYLLISIKQISVK